MTAMMSLEPHIPEEEKNRNWRGGDPTNSTVMRGVRVHERCDAVGDEEAERGAVQDAARPQDAEADEEEYWADCD